MAISELIGGSEENFVSMMNKKAKELGMENTHFMNSHGIDEEGHYTTAKDVAIMSMELINKHPDILKYTSIWMDTLRNGTFQLSSTNKLIRYYEGATGLKTGSTSKALFNLVATATRKNTSFMAVIMKAPSSDIRLNETRQLLDYAFATYSTSEIVSKDVMVDQISVSKNVSKSVDVFVKDSISTLVKKGENVETDETIKYNEVSAPIKENDVVGSIEIKNKQTGDILGVSDLIVKEDVYKSNYSDYLELVFNKFIMN